MVQKRTHDYRGPRSSENLNGHMIDAVPFGVYRGLHVEADGNITPGVLITAEGIRIEETEAVSVAVPAGDPVNPRIDLVVCLHEYEKTVPAPPANWAIVAGTPAADPSPPDIPAFATLVAMAQMDAGAVEWSTVYQMGQPRRVVNATRDADQSYRIIRGDMAATMEFTDPGTGTKVFYVVEAGTYADGEVIDWGAPAFECDKDGIQQVISHIEDSNDAHDASAISVEDADERYAADDVEAALAEIAGAGRTTETVKGVADAKLDKSGGTITGALELQDRLTLDADSVDVVAFDDWITFKRTIQPCQANSDAWTNLGYAWKSADGLGWLYVPIPGIDGAELVSVDVGASSSSGSDLVLYYGFVHVAFADHVVSDQVTFGEVTDDLDANASLVTNVPLVDPSPPNDPLPYAFDGTMALWFKMKASDAHILFNGMTLNYRRKKVAV